MTENAFSFETPLEWILAGTPEMVKLVVKRVGDEYQFEGRGFVVEERIVGSGRPALIIRLGGRGDLLGVIQVEELPSQRTRLRVPAGRVSSGSTDWSHDPDGRLFSAFINACVSEFQRSGFLAAASRFESHAVIHTAARELAGAEDSPAFAAVGNVFRSALIALANELYAPHMLAKGNAEPKGDDAAGKLKAAASHYLAGRSTRYRGGVSKSIDGSWEVANALLHRKNATRDEAEACLALVAAVFDVFSFIVPR